MGKDDKEKVILSPEETATLLRQMADRISGIGAEFESDLLPSDRSFEKLKLSLKRAKNSNGFLVKCKVKSAHDKKSDEDSTKEEEDHPKSVQEQETPGSAAQSADPAGAEHQEY